MLTLMLADIITELNQPKTCCLSFPNGKDDLMSCEATIKAWRRIQQVIWKALTLVF
ncbi:hypothetical protein NC652_006467 [Populus alba x Populus x berolinensis]|nr:hypothetical protein NC652_006467 [Populus alba x Populus x berolinensis]